MKIVPMKVEMLDSMGSDLSVVNAARVSFHKESEWEEHEIFGEDIHGAYMDYQYVLSEKDQKLLSYLAKHNHWSPFAHTSLQFRIKAPIFVARQLVKHQVGGVWNEVSRRYVDDEPEFWFPDVWRGKPVNAKQGSDGKIERQTDVEMITYTLAELALATYRDMLKFDVAPEQARMILPQNTMTEWIWTGSLMFFARVCKLRLDAHAQAETREIAQQIHDLVPTQFEHSWKALISGGTAAV